MRRVGFVAKQIGSAWPFLSLCRHEMASETRETSAWQGHLLLRVRFGMEVARPKSGERCSTTEGKERLVGKQAIA